MSPILRYLCLKIVKIKRRYSHKVKAQEPKPLLDKKAESWSSFSRYSISPNTSFILFVPVYFTAIHVL